MTGLIGKKLGQTHVFDDEGNFVAVTVVEAGPCPVLAIKENAVQLGFDQVDNKKVKKPQLGYFNKLNIPALKIIREFSRDKDREYKVGEELKVDVFEPGDFVDVTGISKGKGFQGGVKRWHWSGGPESHGSMSHRRIGSVGASATPSRVLKGHHLPGQMGNKRVTVQNLKVVKIIPEDNLVLIEGAVPGSRNNYVFIRSAKKKKKKTVDKK